MLVFAVVSAFAAAEALAQSAGEVAGIRALGMIPEAFLPATWLAFSLSYSRGNYREFLWRWRFVLAGAALLPIGLAVGFQSDLVRLASGANAEDVVRLGVAGIALNMLLLIASTLVIANLESTFKAAVGTMRWRIKFAFVGLGVIFGTQIYSRSQALLYSGGSVGLDQIECAAIVAGSLLIAIAYFRHGFGEVDIYPSQAVLQGSVTMLLAGGYLAVVGVLAQIVGQLGWAGTFPFQAFLILAALTVLAVLLLSNRNRQGVQEFVSKHFKRPRHDVRTIWTALTERTSRTLDAAEICAKTVKLVSETFSVLSVSLWRVDEDRGRLVLQTSTLLPNEGESARQSLEDQAVLDALRSRRRPFELDDLQSSDALCKLAPANFRHGGRRLCVPLQAGGRPMGALFLADRVNALPYSQEEVGLLECIADQVAASLANLALNEKVAAARELEAFQTMSVFFVHDLKNTASSLNLMLKNLPVHFDNPEFRADALRAIGGTADRINNLIARLGALRDSLDLHPVRTDLNQIVREALEGFAVKDGVEVVKDLNALPYVVADEDQLRSVVTNLLLNSQDAMNQGGRILIETREQNGRAALSISDNGCGMTEEFMRDSLFRAFHSTKKKGLGIGMFQSRMIVEAHRGRMQVASEVGRGTTFSVILPLIGEEGGNRERSAAPNS